MIKMSRIVPSVHFPSRVPDIPNLRRRTEESRPQHAPLQMVPRGLNCVEIAQQGPVQTVPLMPNCIRLPQPTSRVRQNYQYPVQGFLYNKKNEFLDFSDDYVMGAVVPNAKRYFRVTLGKCEKEKYELPKGYDHYEVSVDDANYQKMGEEK